MGGKTHETHELLFMACGVADNTRRRQVKCVKRKHHQQWVVMGGYVISCPPGHVIESMAVCEEVAEQARAKFALATQGAVILPEPYLS